MRAVLQRVSRAQVSVDGQVIGRCGPGLLVLVCAMQGDGDIAAARLAAKVAKMRIFKDDQGKMNLSVRDIGGAALVISQFTLYADTRKGRRPSWSAAAPRQHSEPLVERFVAALRAQGATVESGRFGAMMQVRLTNDGPMTILVES